jgi:GalNAc-alpha-(1->4)-GalNAc-alpha-(1->3)-diNAcBac-PP-undecaprenol alpha-1,4-N-acetyl-D-galactosaminyltransferase
MSPAPIVTPTGDLEPAPLRLMLITGGLQGGGAERQLSDMANYWARRGNDVTLATWSGPETLDFYPLNERVTRLWLDVGTLRRLPFAMLILSVRRVRLLRRILRASRPDAVVSFIDVPNIYAILASRGLGIRVVVAERTHPAINRTIGRTWRLLRRLCYPQADAVVAQTQDAGRWLERNCRARVQVIPNFLRDLPTVQCNREKTIIAVGRLSFEKGFDLLLQAFASLSARFPDWRVCVLGDGIERASLMQLRDELQMTDRIEFVGEVRQVETWMARAALLVHPSRREGFPNAVLEAMGMGMAVICADCRAGPSELIEDGANGRLVPVEDERALKQAMSELMTSAALRDRLGAEAIKVRARFSQDLIMEKWQACFTCR